MFNIIQPLFIILFCAVFIYIIVTNLIRWHKNNHSPVLTVDAVITSKRTNVTTTSAGTNGVATSSTSYYITFQFQSGDRLEFHVKSHQYAMLAEGDEGKLTFQGTRFLGFERRF